MQWPVLSLRANARSETEQEGSDVALQKSRTASVLSAGQRHGLDEAPQASRRISSDGVSVVAVDEVKIAL